MSPKISLVLAAALATCMASPAQAARGKRSPDALRYELRVSDAHQQYLDIRVQVPELRGRETTVRIPAWAPGSYKIRDFGRHIHNLRAFDLEGQPLNVERSDKQSWRVRHGGEAFHLHYRVFANELSVRTCYVDDAMALINGPCAFVFIDERHRDRRPIELEVTGPEGWRTHIALPKAEPTATHRASNYDALIDAPIMMGLTQGTTFSVDGHDFEYWMLAPSGTNAKLARLARDTRAIVQSLGAMMQDQPSAHYEFMLVLDHAGRTGGLEHMDSTAMILRPWAFRDPEGYERAAKLAAHEYFHAWNVKRMHDRVLGPFDYTRENYSELLWFHEGFTDTMEAKAMLHAGLHDTEQFLDGIAERYAKYRATPGRNVVPVSQLSRDAWIKLYQPASNYRNVAVSYYLKGDLIGTLLDLELRMRGPKNGRPKASVESLMRRLWRAREAGTDTRPITAADIRSATTQEAGEAMDWFFERYVDGREELPLPEALQAMGLTVESRKPWQAGEDGELANPQAPSGAWTGIVGSGTEVRSVDPGSPAAAAGLMPGDEIIAVDDQRVTDLAQLGERIDDRDVGDRIELALFRVGRLVRASLVLTENPAREWSFSFDASSRDASTTRRVQSWLYTTK